MMPPSDRNPETGDFSWVPFYAELAMIVADKPEMLVDLARRLSAVGAQMPAFEDRRADGSRFPLAAMDPFTFFASFNRQTKTVNRIAVLTALKRELTLSSPVPTGFSGIPRVDNRNAWFFPFEASRASDTIPNLCALARLTVEGRVEKIPAELFRSCASTEWVGVRKLTQGLFWLNPKVFVPLDRKTRALLEVNGIAADGIEDLPGYLSVCAAAKAKLGGDLPVLSHRAHLAAKSEPTVWLFQANPKHFDLAADLRRREPGSADSWVVTRFQDEMKAGDRVLLWQAGDAAGIYGVGRLTASPEAQEGPHPYAEGDSGRKWFRVPFVYDEILDEPLRKAALQANPRTSSMTVLQIPQGTNFRITEDEWEEISVMLESGVVRAEGEGRYWKISPGRNGGEWADWKAKGIAAIGWRELGDLAGLDRDGFDERSKKAIEAHDDYTKAGCEQVWRFSQIRPGARLVANDGTSRVLGIGTVTGLYRFVAGEEKPHQLPVAWDDTRERSVQRGGWRKTLIELTKEDFDEIAAIGGHGPTTKPTVPEKAKATITFDGIVARLEKDGYSFPDELVASYMLALQAKRFVILAGISGTGKTKLAKFLADTFSAGSTELRRDAEGDEGYEVRIRPYMLKHNRMWLPVDFLARAPELLEKATSDGRITVRYDGREQPDVRLWRKEGGNLVGLFWSGAIREWFGDTFHEDDAVRVYVSTGSGLRDLSVELRSKRLAPAAKTGAAAEVVAVRPDWTDNRGLLGFYNPLTKEYKPTPFLRLVLAARAEEDAARDAHRDPRPFFVILDEMNLARVEHYFSDFLSCLESGDPLHLHDDQAVEDGETEGDAIPCRLPIPRNLFFTGTVNVDETTYMFSPKVLDRAFVLEFNDVDLRGYGVDSDQDDSPPSVLRLDLFDGALRLAPNPGPEDWANLRQLGDEKLVQVLQDLNGLLEGDHRHFGYRVANEIARFVTLAAEQAGKEHETLWAALDVAILSKVLPKLHGTQQELESLLRRLFDFSVRAAVNGAPTEAGRWKLDRGRIEHAGAGDGELVPALPRSGAKLLRMLRRLGQQGFTAYIE